MTQPDAHCTDKENRDRGERIPEFGYILRVFVVGLTEVYGGGGVTPKAHVHVAFVDPHVTAVGWKWEDTPTYKQR